MFNRSVLAVRGGDRIEHHTHIEKAPTDESVRLLKEMEAAAREKIVATLPLEGNRINGALVVERSVFDMELVFRVSIKLNGKLIFCDHRAPEHEDTTKTLMELTNKVSTAIALQVMDDMLAQGDALRQLRSIRR